jgi:hypothetical protein
MRRSGGAEIDDDAVSVQSAGCRSEHFSSNLADAACVDSIRSERKRPSHQDREHMPGVFSDFMRSATRMTSSERHQSRKHTRKNNHKTQQKIIEPTADVLLN